MINTNSIVQCAIISTSFVQCLLATSLGHIAHISRINVQILPGICQHSFTLLMYNYNPACLLKYNHRTLQYSSIFSRSRSSLTHFSSKEPAARYSCFVFSNCRVIYPCKHKGNETEFACCLYNVTRQGVLFSVFVVCLASYISKIAL